MKRYHLGGLVRASAVLLHRAVPEGSSAGDVAQRSTVKPSRGGGVSSPTPSQQPTQSQQPADGAGLPPQRPEPTFKELCGLISSPNSSASNLVKASFDVSTPDWTKLRDTHSVSDLYRRQRGEESVGKSRRRKPKVSADMEFVRLLQGNTSYNSNRLGQDRNIDNQSKGTSPGSRCLWEDEENLAHWQPTASTFQRKVKTPHWAPHTSAAFKSKREADAYPPGPPAKLILDEPTSTPPSSQSSSSSAATESTTTSSPSSSATSSTVALPVFRSLDPVRTDYDCNTKMDTVEELGKHHFIDAKAGWCYLCEEPVGILAAVHSGDRDHMCIHFFLLLHAQMPMRSWGSAHAVLEAAKSLGGGSLHRHVSATHTMEHLHTQSDAVRRAELHSLLLHLTRPPHRVITHTLQGRAEVGVWYSGERMFRAELARKSTQLFPPMSAGVITQFNHKCWGRTNLERTFDALNIAGILGTYDAPAPTEKDDKAYFMRGLFAALMHVPITEDVTEVGIELARVARQRLVFELIFLQSMQFMVKAQAAMKRLGYPSYDDLVALGLS